jgi:quinol-cytochrome oxidoreductase complex cytochrome b subunit
MTSLYSLYPLFTALHYWISRIGLLVAVVMFMLGLFIGLVRHGDVTHYYRRAVYIIAGVMLAQSLLGLTMYLLGARPYEDVHLIYGLGAILALPFFIFVEVTAKKRPAMGSYMWGFAVLAGILVRGIMTGHA